MQHQNLLFDKHYEEQNKLVDAIAEGPQRSRARRDQGANDLLMSDVVRTNELQVWFVTAHVVDTLVVKVD